MDEYEFHEYPKVLYRDRPKGFKAPKEGGWVPPEPFETLVVNSDTEELEALDKGYRVTPHKEKADA